MNNINFGRIISNYVDNFAESLPESDKLMSMIDFQFENQTKAFIRNQSIWFVVMFFIPFLVIIFGDLKGTALYIFLFTSIIGLLGMYSIELMAIKVQGLRAYFYDKWNIIDQLNPILYFVFFGLSFQYGTDSSDITKSSNMHNLLKLLKCFIIITSWFKLTWFQTQFKSLGLLQQLLIGVISAVIPFLCFYFFWVLFFAIVATILGANKSLADGYKPLTPFVGYFLNTFENSLGNISSPTIDFLKEKSQELKFFDNFIVYLIYLFWWLA